MSMKVATLVAVLVAAFWVTCDSAVAGPEAGRGRPRPRRSLVAEVGSSDTSSSAAVASSSQGAAGAAPPRGQFGARLFAFPGGVVDPRELALRLPGFAAATRGFNDNPSTYRAVFAGIDAEGPHQVTVANHAFAPSGVEGPYSGLLPQFPSVGMTGIPSAGLFGQLLPPFWW